MRHQKEGRKLKRTASHRRALLSALSTALIKHKKIRTTTAKAKETRRIVEPIITRARDAWQREQQGGPVEVHARREVAKFIHDKDALKILFTEIAEKVGKRPGGYTRVLPLGSRIGDGADMSVIELVDYNEAQDLKKRKQRVERSKAAQQRRKAADDRKAAKAAPEVEVHDAEEEAPAEKPKRRASKAKAAKAEAAPAAAAPEAEAAPEAAADEPAAEATDDKPAA